MTTRGADIEAALVYTCVWPVVAIVACVASFSVLALANALELRYASYAIVMTLNVAPAFVCGLVVYRILSRRNGATGARGNAISSRLIRVSPLGAIAVLLQSFIVKSNSDPAFGLVAQLVVWPLAATIGGIAGEISTWRATRSVARQPAA